MTQSIVTPLATRKLTQDINSNLSIAIATTPILALADKISLCLLGYYQVGV
ncbi:hypothetical protein H6G97_46590 [Nostoc flagelliforme FACHB-838]|uniref:Uncharacterized protein n=1 Tax=Nostoc flagelliforme FACHB-838 TaxID=2692904 RepID=A0ABR8E3Q5_9NOSO|nr:hypothetical protein [Nostoc flagelliforme]MBD2536362.1 hypothetical protein [Nostoc flagelliforme FACHB-838]